MPALPPQVHYSRGQLTIVAENSTLADILRAVRTQTGADVEVPPNATERVVAHLGPGPARDVLDSAAQRDPLQLRDDRFAGASRQRGSAYPDFEIWRGSRRFAVHARGPEHESVQVDEQGVQGVDISEQPVDDPG